MFELNLELQRCTKNVQELHNNIQYQLCQAINYFQRYDENKLTPILMQICKKDQVFLMEKMSKLTQIHCQYIKTLLFWHKNSKVQDKTQQIMIKWSSLLEQSQFCRPYLQIANYHQNNKDYDKAEEYYNKCLTTFGDNDIVYQFMGKMEQKVIKQMSKNQEKQEKIIEKNEQIRKELKQNPKINNIQALKPIGKKIYKKIALPIQNNFQDVSQHWKKLEFCRIKNPDQRYFNHLQEFIKNSKRQPILINKICKQILQKFNTSPSCYKRIMHIFSILKKHHKKSLSVYLYQCFIAILNEQRQTAIKASEALKLALFTDESMFQEQKQDLLKNHAFLIDKLINCFNIDLLSLSQFFKNMINFFQYCLNKQKIEVSQVLIQQIMLKNLLISSKQSQISTIICLLNIPVDTMIEYSNQIFIKQEKAFIIYDQNSMRKYLNTCQRIIIFPQSLSFIEQCIINTRKKFNIFIIKMHDLVAQAQAYIQLECNRLKDRNGRLNIFPNINFAKIHERNILNQQK